MADISRDARLSPDDQLLTATSKLFIHLWVAAWKQADGTCAGDADGLHDMRVALRRLRSALQNFEGTKAEPLLDRRVYREFKEQRRELGKLGDLLGAVRDCDVLLEYIQEYLKTHPAQGDPDRSGLTHFTREIITRRAEAFTPMVKFVIRARGAGKLQEEFGRWALGLPALAAPPLNLTEASRRIVAERIADVHAHSFALADGTDAEGHHEFRKALRRLRYALETLGVCLTGSPKSALKSLVHAQDLLGEMQDRTVLRDMAMSHLSTNPTDVPTLPPDVEAFLHWGEMRRRRLLGQARAWWTKHETGGVLDEIATLVAIEPDSDALAE